MEAINSITSKTVVIALDDIDTDQIIPARFLTTTTREGLGEHLFTDWRYDKDGTPKSEFVLNSAESKGAQILIAGRNFGCGSSREHAPWALLDFGLRVVISTEIADIFFNNALKNGFIPVVVDKDTHAWLLENPGTEVTVDLESSTVIVSGREPVPFSVDNFAKYCLLNGLDQMGFLTQHGDDIAAYEARTE